MKKKEKLKEKIGSQGIIIPSGQLGSMTGVTLNGLMNGPTPTFGYSWGQPTSNPDGIKDRDIRTSGLSPLGNVSDGCWYDIGLVGIIDWVVGH